MMEGTAKLWSNLVIVEALLYRPKTEEFFLREKKETSCCILNFSIVYLEEEFKVNLLSFILLTNSLGTQNIFFFIRIHWCAESKALRWFPLRLYSTVKFQSEDAIVCWNGWAISSSAPRRLMSFRESFSPVLSCFLTLCIGPITWVKIIKSIKSKKKLESPPSFCLEPRTLPLMMSKTSDLLTLKKLMCVIKLTLSIDKNSCAIWSWHSKTLAMTHTQSPHCCLSVSSWY